MADAIPGQYAQDGNEGRCLRCGRLVEFRQVASDAFTDAPVYRWVALRKTKLAPIPVVCPETKGPHATGSHGPDGAPRIA